MEYDEAGKFSDGLMAVMQIDQAGYRDAVGDADQVDEGDKADEEEAQCLWYAWMLRENGSVPNFV